MNFYIRQGSTEPILKLELVDDGKNDKSSFNDRLLNSTITFDMLETHTQLPVILNEPCLITTRKTKYNNVEPDYYIVYQFTEEDTSIKGKYEGVVNIQFLDEDSLPTTKLKVPIMEKLFINVI